MAEPPIDVVRLTIPPDADGQRLDRALAMAAEVEGLALSRSRLVALLAEGAIAGPSLNGKTKAVAGTVFTLSLPPPVAAKPEPEAIALDVVHEDRDLIIVNKPAGMVVHPAPGSETGTLVNALLHHCGDELAGIGGERRPGIVHRIDKDTSGLLVAAKTEAAHTGLSRLFAAHDITREYTALVWGSPERASPALSRTEGVSFEVDGSLRIETEIARHPNDRKRMAVVSGGGRRAVTYARLDERFGPDQRPFASRVSCRLETGRTHQIRVHMAHIGHGLIGDPTYGRRRIPSKTETIASQRAIMETFSRQALHAALLGFKHPISGKNIEFQANLPPDMHDLLMKLRRNP